MKKYDMLRAIVIVQAICMIVLAGAVMVKVWPLPQLRGTDETKAPGSLPGNIGAEEEDDIDLQQPIASEEPIAKVGDRSVTQGQLTAELFQQYGDAVLRILMVRAAIDLEAEAYGLSVAQHELEQELAVAAEGYGGEDEYLAVMEEQLGMTKKQLLEEIKYRLLMDKITVRSVAVSDAEVLAYLVEYPEEFAPMQMLHIRWILTWTERDAEELLDKLADGEEFALLAYHYSVDEFTADGGGDIGMIRADDPYYPESMLKVAKGLQIGEIAGPIAIDGGYALVQLMGRSMSEGLSGFKLQDAVRKQLALERALPLRKREDELLAKYGAVILK